MSYSDMCKVAKNKFSEYTNDQVAYAIKDCHETLKLNKDNPTYSEKLWVEIDALRDRGLVLSKQKKSVV
jgi:hypothetical protein